MSADELRHVGSTLGERAVFGFWVFLMSDAVIFALLFATYGSLLDATAGGPTPAALFRIGDSLIETWLLLSSSFTFGMASIAMKYGNARENVGPLLAWSAVTVVLGLSFTGMELHDALTLFQQGAYPSRSGYLSVLFALVPFHGLHVVGGSIWLIVVMVQLLTFGRDVRVNMNMLRLGLFWHFLGIVWVAIFSVVYLQGLIR